MTVLVVSDDSITADPGQSFPYRYDSHTTGAALEIARQQPDSFKEIWRLKKVDKQWLRIGRYVATAGRGKYTLVGSDW